MLNGSKKSILVILALVVLVGIAVRSYHLTSRSLWFDEAFSWRLIQFSYTEMIARDAADVHPPLYYVVLKSWATVFGSSLVSLRSLSTLAAGLTIAAGYLTTAYAFRSRAAGLLAAILLAVSGFQIQYAWEARMYTLGTAAVLVSTWLLLRATRATISHDSRARLVQAWLAYAILTAAFAYLHYFSFFSIAAQVVFLVGYLLVHTRSRPVEIIQSPLLWYPLLAGFVMFLLYLPWLPTFFAQNAQVQQVYWIPPIGGWSIPDTFYRMFAPTPAIPRHIGIGWIALAAAPSTLTLLSWLLLVKSGRPANRDGSWLIMLSGLTPFLLSIPVSFLGQSVYQDRFFVFAHLFVVIGLAALIVRLRPRWLAKAAAVAAVIAFIAAHVSFWQQLDIPNRPGARIAAADIILERSADEPIIVSSPFIYFAILHYAEENFDIDTTPRLYSDTGELSHFAGGPILLESDIIGPGIFDEHSSLWVVDTTGFGAAPLTVPSGWERISTREYPEVFEHQGEVIVHRYQRM